MADVTSTAGALQSGMQQLKLQLAERNAQQAEQTARGLREAAGRAQREAEEAKENARSLGVQSDRADRIAARARQGLAMAGSVEDVFGRYASALDRTLAKQETASLPSANTAITPAAEPAPVVNTQGQITGTVIDTTA